MTVEQMRSALAAYDASYPPHLWEPEGPVCRLDGINPSFAVIGVQSDHDIRGEGFVVGMTVRATGTPLPGALLGFSSPTLVQMRVTPTTAGVSRIQLQLPGSEAWSNTVELTCLTDPPEPVCRIDALQPSTGIVGAQSDINVVGEDFELGMTVRVTGTPLPDVLLDYYTPTQARLRFIPDTVGTSQLELQLPGSNAWSNAVLYYVFSGEAELDEWLAAQPPPPPPASPRRTRWRRKLYRTRAEREANKAKKTEGETVNETPQPEPTEPEPTEPTPEEPPTS